MKILAFGASNARQSINRTLAVYAANRVGDATVEVLDIHDYEMPIFSMEREQELGQPPQAKLFLQKITEADAIVVSFAEHNGSYTAAYKNLFDWASRIDPKVYQNKPMLILATSPGKGGAATVFAAAKSSLPHFAADVRASVSVPSFYENFDVDSGEFSNSDMARKLEVGVHLLQQGVA